MTSPTISRLPVADIVVSDGRRPLNKGAVETLAESLAAIGLQCPIIVKRTVSDDGVHVHTLIAGAHRLAAARRVGWSHIECIVKTNISAVEAEMCEIAENLHRAELTKEQRDQQIRRYAELLESKKSLVVQNEPPMDLRKDGRRKGPQHEKGTAATIADQTGLSKSTVQRALNPKPVPPASRPYNPLEAYNKWASGMNRLWGQASQEWRDRWLSEVDRPVMDERFGGK